MAKRTAPLLPSQPVLEGGIWRSKRKGEQTYEHSEESSVHHIGESATPAYEGQQSIQEQQRAEQERKTVESEVQFLQKASTSKKQLEYLVEHHLPQTLKRKDIDPERWDVEVTGKESPAQPIQQQGNEPWEQRAEFRDERGQRWNVSPWFFQELMEKEAKNLNPMILTSGQHELNVGVATTKTTRERFEQEIIIGKKTFKRTELAPEGMYFDIPEGRQIIQTAPLNVTYDVSREQAKASREYRNISTTRGIFEDVKSKQLHPDLPSSEMLGLKTRTLLSEYGADYIGSLVLGGNEEVILSKQYYDLTYGSKETLPQSFYRGVIEGAQSPIVEIPMTMVGVGLIGMAGKTAAGARVLSSTAGKITLLGVGGLATAKRGYDITYSVQQGEYNRALGLGLTTAADVFAGATMYRIISKPHVGEKLTGMSKLAKRTEVTKLEGRTTQPDLKQLRISGVHKDTPLRETINVKDIKGMEKAGWRISTKKIPLEVEQFTMKEGGWPKYVAREVKTGKIFQWGEKVSALREAGIRSKFPEPMKSIDLFGRRGEEYLSVFERTGGQAKEASIYKRFDFLMPMKRVIKPKATSKTYDIIKPTSSGTDKPFGYYGETITRANQGIVTKSFTETPKLYYKAETIPITKPEAAGGITSPLSSISGLGSAIGVTELSRYAQEKTYGIKVSQIPVSRPKAKAKDRELIVSVTAARPATALYPPALATAIASATSQTTVYISKPRYKTPTRTALTPAYRFDYKAAITPPRVPPPSAPPSGIDLPDFDFFAPKGKGRKNTKQSKKYQPSLIAQAFGIKGRPPKIATGFGIRPIIKKRRRRK